jgi:hypothetical protein
MMEDTGYRFDHFDTAEYRIKTLALAGTRSSVAAASSAPLLIFLEI